MQAFMDFVGQYWLAIVFFAIWARMRHGPANIAKYRRWDRIRARKRVGKRRKR